MIDSFPFRVKFIEAFIVVFVTQRSDISFWVQAIGKAKKLDLVFLEIIEKAIAD